jgi:hypothetical protein
MFGINAPVNVKRSRSGAIGGFGVTLDKAPGFLVIHSKYAYGSDPGQVAITRPITMSSLA